MGNQKAICLLLILTASVYLNAQTTVQVQTGLGIPEMYNVGARVNIKQSHVGIKIGTLLNSEKNYAFQFNGAYHFAGQSKFTELRPFYTQASIEYFFETIGSLSTEKAAITSLRLGRDFHLSKQFIIDLNLGAGLIVFKECTGPTWCITPEIWPSGSLSIGFRI